MLWLLASESDNGAFNASTEELTFRLRQQSKDIEAGLKPLIDAGFFTVEHVASDVQADRQHVAVPEERREETETDGGFALFWSCYPRKAAKPAALKAFKTAAINGELINTILEDVENRKAADDWLKDGGKYVPNPATYLNQRRWEDENSTGQSGVGAFL